MRDHLEVADSSDQLASRALEILQRTHPNRVKGYERGRYLFMQGDPAEQVFVIRSGAVKVFSVSPEGKAYAWNILGHGRLPGIVSALLAKEHESTAEVATETEAYAIPLPEFRRILDHEPEFAGALMQELAQAVDSLSNDIRSLCSMNAQQRLMYGLVKLAEEHGVVTRRGVKIDLDITHEDLANLIAADRSTVTINLNLLKRQGHVWREGDRLVILAPRQLRMLDSLAQAVGSGDALATARWARQIVEAGVDPIAAVDAMARSIQEVGQGFARNDLALSDVLLAVDAMKSAMTALEEQGLVQKQKSRASGRVVIGTVRGDIHDIGKTVVSTLLEASGFEVIDLGVDVTARAFTEAVGDCRPNILALSAFLTSSASEPAAVIEVLHSAGLRERVRIITGGNAMNREISQEMGADGFATSASEAVSLARKLARNRNHHAPSVPSPGRAIA